MALLAGLFSGIIGAMGLGGGAVLIIYLTAFAETAQLEAQGINLIFFIPIAAVAVTIYAIKKQIEWKTVLKISGVGIVGVALGIAAAEVIGGAMLGKIFGIVLVVLGIKEIFTKTVAKDEK